MDLPTVITRGFTVTSRGLWRLVIARAACSASGLNPDDWYPVSVPVAAARREAAGAIAVCAGCAAREPCLELSLRNWAAGRYGVWGGTVLFPAALAIVVETFDLRSRGRALALFFGIAGGLTAIGPITGGYLLDWLPAGRGHAEPYAGGSIR
jgi:MFS family permease